MAGSGRLQPDENRVGADIRIATLTRLSAMGASGESVITINQQLQGGR
jgi:hypothetical protein